MVSADTSGGDAVRVRLSYADFRHAYAGDWGSRLQVLAYPSCVLTTPDEPGCDSGVVVASDNDPATETLSFITADPDAALVPAVEVTAPDEPVSWSEASHNEPAAFTATTSGGTVYMLAAASAGDTGDYGANPVPSSASWAVGDGSGSFSYSYPFLLPRPAVGGPAPSVSLDYSSGSVDGMTRASNGQASQSGIGWDMDPGFITRTQIPCAKDSTVNMHGKGDLCWKSASDGELEELSIVLNGHASRLVQEGTTNTFRLADDPGWQVVRYRNAQSAVTSGDADNTDDDNEAFRVRTPDGTTYWFGWGRTAAGGDDGSTLTVPVYANDPGEPCYNASNEAASYCSQAWRWGLDRVVDRHGNEIRYEYGREINYYSRYGLTSNHQVYDRAGYLTRITYGASRAAAGNYSEVVFTIGDRCLETVSLGTACPGGPRSAPASWPDVPGNFLCDSNDVCLNGSPTFFSTKRYAAIATRQYWNSVQLPVDSYTLEHRFPSPPNPETNGGPRDLWLLSITRTAKGSSGVGADFDLPAVMLDGDFYHNRVVTPSGEDSFFKRRVTSVRTETGGRVDVTYGHTPGRTCDAAYVSGRGRQASDRECFAQRLGEDWEWWHKYVVLRTVTNDDALGYRVGTTTTTNLLGRAQVLDYEYQGSAGWRYASTTAVVPADDKSWDDWRGYGTTVVHNRSVTTAQVPTSTDVSARRVVVFRGLHGTRLDPSGGTRVEKVTTAETTPGSEFSDLVQLEGRVAEESTWGAGLLMSRTNYGYGYYDTATRSPYLPAHFTYTARVATLPRVGAPIRTVTYAVDDGGTSHRGTLLGAVTITRDDQATAANATDDLVTCTGWAASPETTYLSDAPVRGTTLTSVRLGDCNGAVQSHHINYYDGSLDYTVIPSEGDVTRTADGTGSQYVFQHHDYDVYGRETKTSVPSYNAADQNWTVTNYNPDVNSNALLVKIETKTPAVGGVPVLTTTQTLDARRGLPQTTTDPNGQSTLVWRDPLGRPVYVDKPDRTDTHSITFAYVMGPTAAGRVATTITREAGKSETSWSYFDGWGRPISTRVQNQKGDAYISSFTGYDSRGLAWLSVPAAKVSNNATVGDPVLSTVEHYTASSIDALHRPSVVTDASLGVENWSTRYTYEAQADVVATTPPGTTTDSQSKTRTDLDAAGRPVKVTQYVNGKSPDPAGKDDVADYTYTPSGQLKTIITPTGPGGTAPVTYTYAYDQLGRRTSATDPDTGLTSYQYDALGNTTRVDDATSNPAMLTTYDTLGRPTLRKEEGGADVATWTYDTVANGLGLLASTSSVTSLGTFTSTVGGYTVMGQPSTVTESYPATALPNGTAGSLQVGFTYDQLGQVKSTSYPAVGGLAAVTTARTNGNYGTFKSLTTNETSQHTLAWADYDALDRPIALTSASGTVIDNTGDTSDVNRLTRAYAWATNGRLTGLDAKTGNTSSEWTQLGYNYLYDVLGNPTRVTGTRKDTSISPGTQAAWCYTYDGISRLTAASTGVPAGGSGTGCQPGADSAVKPVTGEQYALTFGYAQTRLSTIASGSKTSTYAYNATQPHAPSSITASGSGSSTGLPTAGAFQYDAVGRATTWTPSTGPATTYGYDSEGNLKTVDDASTGAGADITNAYDAGGIRIARKTPTETVLYLAGTEITKTTSGTLKARRSFSTPGGTPLAVQESNGSGTTTWTWLFADAQDSVRMSKNAATGAVEHHTYYPFGDLISNPSNLPGEHGFLGKTHDPDGSVRLDHRNYDPGLATLTTPDPLMDPMDPQNLNAYAYSRNNPIAFSDPSGLRCTRGDVEVACPRNPDADPGTPIGGDSDPFDGTIDSEEGKYEALADVHKYEGTDEYVTKQHELEVAINEYEARKEASGGVASAVGLAVCSWIPIIGVGCDGYDLEQSIDQDGAWSWSTAASAAGFVPFGDGFKIPKQIDNIHDAASAGRRAAKSADEAVAGVDDVLSGLGKGRNSGVKTVGSDAELSEVYGTLTRGGTPIDVPGYKGTWIERADGVRVGIRDASKSGGRTIDIRYPDGTTRKVHIE
ncbi:MAG: hypothetical protein J7518_10105 [Nocardioidaceae bacterium]|nr:hypothetical protein [Nocardioidaceae bacterium]